MTWSEVARAQHGVVSRGQLRDCGLVDRTISRLLDRQELWPVCGGLFLVRGAPLTYAAQTWGAVLLTGGVLGFDTAGYLWEQAVHQPEHVHVCVLHPIRSHAPSWIRLHRVQVPAFARATRLGLPITSQSWTLLDLVGAARCESDASGLLDRGLQRHWVTPDALDRRLRSCPGRTGNARLRKLRSQLGDGAAARSERLLHQILRGAEIAGWKANHRISLGNGEAAVADVAIPSWRLVIEVDGWAYHSDVDRFRRDRRRQNSLVTRGWTVIRFTWTDLTDRPDYVLATIRNFGAQRDVS